MKINIIGGGLAGSEAAYFLASHGVEVTLYDQKPVLGSAFHSADFGELVCSNSLKSEAHDNACGLLKAEIRVLGSLIMKAADDSRVPSGQDLAVDRNKFSSYITAAIKGCSNIHVVSKNVSELSRSPEVINIVCTGPVTTPEMCKYLEDTLGKGLLSFYDAAAPLIFGDSIDKTQMYRKSRYDKGEGNYLNIPLNKEQYVSFVNELKKAERVILHDFEHFEGCLPVEVMAAREIDTLRFGPLKPQGLFRSDDDHSYAVVQLRQDDVAGRLYGLVGFQTNLTYKEQKRVFSLLPGLEKAKYARFGLMHQNFYLNAPSVLNRDLSLLADSNIYIGGQLSGVEGYVESAATGLLAGYYVLQRINGKKTIEVPLHTMLGSLVNYLIMSSFKNFAPMNATYGIYQYPYKEDKTMVYTNSIKEITEWRDRIFLSLQP